MKKFSYLLYLFIITFVVAEVGIRFLTKTSATHVDQFLGVKHRYLLPLPTADAYFVEGKIGTEKADKYRVYDDTLGWSHAPWGWDTANFPCFANDRGLRITRAAWEDRVAAKNHYNIITIGNSFTHGDAVDAEHSWPQILADSLNSAVGNLGVGGYGLQQAFMRLIHSGISGDTVFFGAIWSDFERAREPVFSFYQGGNKTKPLLSFKEDDSWDYINVPVLTPEAFYAEKKAHTHEIFDHIPGFNNRVFSTAIWTKSYLLRLLFSIRHQKKYFQPHPIYLTPGPDLNHCIKIFQAFHQYCLANNMFPMVVLLDTEQNFVDAQNLQGSNPWTLVKEQLAAKGIPHVDFHAELVKAYQKERSNVIHPEENLHYSEKGNALVAQLLAACSEK